MSLTILSSVKNVLKTTKKHFALLEEMGIFTIEDFLLYFPREYEDRSSITELSEIRADKKNVLLGIFSSVRREKTPNGFSLVKANFIEDSSKQSIECVWFNAKGKEHTLPLQQKVMVVAKAKLGYGKISLQSPDVQIYDGELSEGLAPIYAEHYFLKQKWIFRKIHEEVLPLIRKKGRIKINIPNIIPQEIRKKKGLLDRREAIEILHYPKNVQSLDIARKTFAFEELFVLQLVSLQKKKNIQEKGRQEKNIVPIPLNSEMIKDFFATLPFTPTNAQKISMFEMFTDYEKDVPMQRLLEGDVGSGKTLVAVCALLPIIQAGYQVALLAPTEILASQLKKGVEEFLKEAEKKGFWKKWKNIKNKTDETDETDENNKKLLHIQTGQSELFYENSSAVVVEFLSGSVKGKKREKILQDLRQKKIDVLVGTHALLEEWVVFNNLGLVIIDEQHRFGVIQREKLLQKGSPHFLQMSATPIPRSLAIVAFGDQDLSVLNELPPGRKPIETKVITPSERRTVEIFIETEIEKGRQVFIICPLVEESEHFDELKSATEEYVRLSEHIFPNKRVSLLHGKMKAKEKDEIMNDFKEKKFDILVATSVVEVGVDVPNATIMMIEGAERFGLSQLHQFRGRVGRGKHKSYCFLCPTKQNQNARLQAMEKTQNGFELAEIDMHLRGAGEVFGLKQSGIPDLKMATMMDGRLVVDAKKEAETFLEQNEISTFQALERAVVERRKKMMSQ